MSPTVIGSIGVTLLLVAFVLNLVRAMTENSRLYLSMNCVGAGMAAYYAWAGGMVPFVLLEAVWGGAALARLFRVLIKNSRR